MTIIHSLRYGIKHLVKERKALKNYEIINMDNALGELVNEKLVGRFKFKLFKIKAETEKLTSVVWLSLEGVEDETERLEILNEEQEFSVSDKLTVEELESLPLSLKQIGALQSIIDMGDEQYA